MRNNRIRLIWEIVSSSYWFVPGTLFIATLALVVGVLWADLHGFEVGRDYAFLIFDGGVESVRSILSALSTSMITLTGTVFSLTIVALTVASNQFGSRLLRGFMRSTANQFVLGTFLCTFIYAVLILTVVRGAEGEFVPRLSVSIGIVLAVGNAALLIFFIHHVARSIHANKVAAIAAGELRYAVDALIPPDDEKQTDARNESPWPGGGRRLNGDRRGYLLAIDEKSILALAEKRDWRVRLRVRAGDFVSEHDSWLEVAEVDEIDGGVRRQLLRCFDVGIQRTLVQDYEAAVLQLVEVAVRALSPGINDPFTAVVCIDHLGAVMTDLALRRFREFVFYDLDDQSRVWRDVIDFDGALDVAFNQIRQAGAGHMAVLVRLMEVFARMRSVTRDAGRRASIRRHAQLVVEAGCENLTQPSDADLLETYLKRVDKSAAT